LAGTLALAATACALLPAAASADEVKIGSSLDQPMDTAAVCSAQGCVAVQRALVSATTPLPLRSPVSGTVTSWSVRSIDNNAFYSLRILRPFAVGGYTGSGTVAAPTPIPAVTPVGGVTLVYPASIAIAKGDAIGLELGAGAGGMPSHSGTSGPQDEVDTRASLADGGDGIFSPSAPHQLLVQATVRYCEVPDLRGQKTAAAQALLTAADCTAKVKRKPKKKKKKRGRVLSQGTPAGTDLAPDAVVEITVGKRPKARKKK
jgi:hypothetical protein